MILNHMTDQQFAFKHEINRLPHIHWFTMERSGRGWKTLEYSAEFCRVQCPIALDDILEMSLKNNETLHKIKKQFPDDVLACVVDGHLTAPSTLYQLVIDDISEEQKKAFLEYLKIYKDGNFCDYLIDIRWLDELFPEKYKELTAY